jgi:phenylacetate-coenzyme A ligase PaaK-like adenylate-forming protein
VVTDNSDRGTASWINPALGDAFCHHLVLGSSDAADRELIEILRASIVPLLCARPRCLLRLAEIDEELGGSHFQPRAILASGDNLYEDDRRRMAAWFGCPLRNAYISQEGGFAAIDCACEAGLHVLPGRAVVEVLGPAGSLQAEGAGELILTNLENWAMPLIRYRIGDRAVVRRGACECGFEGPSLLDLSGRDAPYFHIGGRRFNPYRLNAVFELLPVKQFQVVQHGSAPPRVRWIPRCPDADIPAVARLIAEGFQAKAGTAPGRVEAVTSLGEPGQKMQRYVRLEPL